MGLAITQVLKLTKNLKQTSKQWVSIESNMISVERAIEYTKFKQETKVGKVVPKWPSKGSITFENICLTYGERTASVLKNINFEINPGEQIGIVGRSGAGKSSLIAVLYRLYEFQGTVRIDGIDTKVMSLNYLR